MEGSASSSTASTIRRRKMRTPTQIRLIMNRQRRSDAWVISRVDSGDGGLVLVTPTHAAMEKREKLAPIALGQTSNVEHYPTAYGAANFVFFQPFEDSALYLLSVVFHICPSFQHSRLCLTTFHGRHCVLTTFNFKD